MESSQLHHHLTIMMVGVVIPRIFILPLPSLSSPSLPPPPDVHELPKLSPSLHPCECRRVVLTASGHVEKIGVYVDVDIVSALCTHTCFVYTHIAVFCGTTSPIDLVPLLHRSGTTSPMDLVPLI